MAELWSDYTDGILKNLDKQVSMKYKLTLRSLLTDPAKYASQPNMHMTIENLKEEVHNYVEGRVKEMGAEKKAFEDALMRADAVTSQLGQSIVIQARQNNVPIIKPVTLDRDTDDDERIYIDSVDNNIIALLNKLVMSAMLIVDSTTTFGNYKVGEWLFSGHRHYVLVAYLPSNSYVLLQQSQDELINLLNTASSFIKGL